jgi:hypothetical protein
MGEVEVSNEELRTVRDAMRALNRMVDALESGDHEEFILCQKNRMRAPLRRSQGCVTRSLLRAQSSRVRGLLRRLSSDQTHGRVGCRPIRFLVFESVRL